MKASDKRPAAHEGQGRDFDDALLKQSRDLLVIDQIKQRVIKRAQVRVDFVLQIAGQKSEFLARFDRRARENYPVDALLHQRLDRLRDSQISIMVDKSVRNE